jgi:hypothetical protein
VEDGLLSSGNLRCVIKGKREREKDEILKKAVFSSFLFFLIFARKKKEKETKKYVTTK